MDLILHGYTKKETRNGNRKGIWRTMMKIDNYVGDSKIDWSKT